MIRRPACSKASLTRATRIHPSTGAPKYDKHPSGFVVGIGVGSGIDSDPDTVPDPDGRRAAHDFVGDTLALVY
jgi:hypothetical protein